MGLEGFKGILKDLTGCLEILMDLKGFQGLFFVFLGILRNFKGLTLFDFVKLCLNLFDLV